MVAQPEGTYRFALNAVSDPMHLGSLANEYGNTLCVELPARLVGPPVVLEPGKFVVFLRNNSIGIVDIEACTYVEVVRLSEFGFSELVGEQVVTGIARKVNGCEQVVYFFDGVHSDKRVYLDRLDKHMDINGQIDPATFLIDAMIEHPLISAVVEDGDGRLEYGLYQIQVQYVNRGGDVVFTSLPTVDYVAVTNAQSGAFNLDEVNREDGGAPLASKVLRIRIEGIPDYVVRLRLVVHRISQGIATYVSAQDYPASGTVTELIWRGYNADAGDQTDDWRKYVIDYVRYDSSYDAIAVEGRLVRYNLRRRFNDYSEYQKYASAIRIRYVARAIPKEPDEQYHRRQMAHHTTFIGGEVVLPYIVYIHSDGTISPPFPLIGRAALPGDEATVNGQPRWKYHDTSIPDAEPIEGYAYSGRPGFYRIDQQYLNPPLYCGHNFWGTSEDGEVAGPVRLVRMPSRSQVPLEDQSNYYALGLHFENIAYPQGVVGHYIAIAYGNNIKAAGYMAPAYVYADSDTPDMRYLGGYHWLVNYTPQPEYVFTSLDVLHGLVGIDDAQFVTIEGVVDVDTPGQSSLDEIGGYFHGDMPYDDLKIYTHYRKLTNWQPLGDRVIGIERVRQIEASDTVYLGNDERLTNLSLSNGMVYMRLEELISNERIDQMHYVIIHGHNRIQDIYQAPIVLASGKDAQVIWGRNFISPVEIDNIASADILKRNLLKVVFNKDTSVIIHTEIMQGVSSEGRINAHMIAHADGMRNVNAYTQSNYVSLFAQKVSQSYMGKYQLAQAPFYYWSGYNEAYSKVDSIKRFVPLPARWDWCNECIDTFPNRMIYSAVSTEEEAVEGWLFYSPNDYVDMPVDGGPIRKVDYQDGVLIVRSERSVYQLPVNARQMQVDEATVYIGTGSFLSIPPRQMYTAADGYAGQLHKLDSINTPGGVIWVDRSSGRIMLWGGQMAFLSNDMYEFWRRELLGSGPVLLGYDHGLRRIMVTIPGKLTASYSLNEGGFLSFHSYIPDWYGYDRNTMFTVLGSEVWVHGSGPMCNFYGIQFPFVVELIRRSGVEAVQHNVVWYQTAYDPFDIVSIDKFKYKDGVTFTRLLAYNDRQTTGLQELRLNELRPHVPACSIRVKRSGEFYRASPLRDMAVTDEIWSNDISAWKVGTQGYFDAHPLYDCTKARERSNYLRGSVVAVRLIDDLGQVRLSVDMADVVNMKHDR
ncbi:MAG: hypothetical protein KatS3mg054_0070 [Chloroflexus sp.]|nr:MAG: hypothetical protein KatS3mg054_0070 [Chloroflexus sp.]